MTVIVAVRDEQGVVVGADTRTMFGWEAATGRQEKVTAWRAASGRVLYLGASGAVRLANVARFLELPEGLGDGGTDDHAWMVKSLVPALRAASSEAGFTEKEKDREAHGGALLAVTGGRVFSVGSDWSVFEPVDPYWTIGSGAAIASGALHAILSVAPGLSAEHAARAALEAACAHSASCGAPFQILRCE